MFDSQINDHAQDVFDSIKSTSADFAKSAFSGGIQMLKDRVSARAPVAASIVSEIVAKVQEAAELKKQRHADAAAYVDNNPERIKEFQDVLRKESKTPDKLDDKAINEDIKKILVKLHEMTDESSKGLKKSDELYKKYNKFYEDYAEELLYQQHAKETESYAREYYGTDEYPEIEAVKKPDSAIPDKPKTVSDTKKKPVREKSNEPKTVKSALSEVGHSYITKVFDDRTISILADKTKEHFGLDNETNSVEPAKQTTAENIANPIVDSVEPTKQSTAENISHSHEPKTVKSALSEVGHSYITKVFDDRVISKYADKTQKALSLTDSDETNEENVESKVDERILDELKTVNKNLEKLIETPEEKTEEKTDELHEKEAEIEADKKNPEKELEKEVEKKNPDKSDKKPSIVEKGKEKLKNKGIEVAKDKGGKFLEKVFPNEDKTLAESGEGVLSQGAKLARPGLAAELGVGAAGTAGAGAAGAGTAGAGAAGVGAAGVGAAGSIGLAELLAAGAVGYGAYKLAGALGAGDLGSAIADALPSPGGDFDPKQGTTTTAAKKATIEPTQKKSAATVESLSDKKSETAAAKTKDANAAAAPVTINNISNSGGGGSNTMVVAKTTRNQESTFERVQMQDFWPRAI